MATKLDKRRGSYDTPKLARNKKSRKTKTHDSPTGIDSDRPNHETIAHTSQSRLILLVRTARMIRGSIKRHFTTQAEMNE